MIFEGEYNYFINGEAVLHKDLHKLTKLDMTVEVDGFNVYYFSPKEEPVVDCSWTKCGQKDCIRCYPKKEEGLITIQVPVGSLIVPKEAQVEWAKEVLKQEDMNRLVEEELEKQELSINSLPPQKDEKIRKERRLAKLEEEVKRQQKEFEVTSSSNRKGVLQGEIKADWIDFIGNSMKRGKIINYKPSGTEEITKKMTEEREQKVIEDWEKKADIMSGDCDRLSDFTIGKKETEGKLDYELDWEFIQQMAERMSQNKGKYEPYNWKKSMDVEKLKQSLFRHVIEIMKGSYSDDSREFGHLESVALNALFINYQLKNLHIKK